MNWQEQEQRTTRARRVAKVEALLRLHGKNVHSDASQQLLAACYRPKDKIPIASFRKWRKERPYAEDNVMEALDKLLEEKEITQDFVLDEIKAMVMQSDNGKLGRWDRLARLVQLPVDPVKRSHSIQEHGRLEEYTGPQALPPAQVEDVSFDDIEPGEEE